jgi:carboxyl-terminal processing protease
MKQILILFVLAVLAINSPHAGTFPDVTEITFNEINPEAHHKRVTQLVAHMLTRSHYQKKEVDDSLSSQLLDQFISRLDFNRLYFLKSDIDTFERFRFMLDDYLNAGHVKPFYEIFRIYQKRFATRLQYIFNRLQTEFDYTREETINLDRETAMWPKSAEELNELWRKRLKHDALNLKLAGKKWEGISETLQKRYKNLYRRMSQYNSEDVYQITMNSFGELFDPHTNYFSPRNFDNFKIQMSQSFEGIGARLTTETEYTVVAEIIPGGPADKSNLLHTKDKIIGVGQDESGEIVDVIGWRIDDVVQLIRGPKDSIVRMLLLRARDAVNAAPDTISIVRDKVNIKDQVAKGKIIDIEQDGKSLRFGIIDIPSFYSDFDARRAGLDDYNSTTRDVRQIIKEFETENISGIIIDLRHNGGGFLNEAVDLTGLFIEKGPVVQVRNTGGKVKVEWDDDPEQIYNGPLAVLVDRLSASASEIFAAAIQDYKRGIIIGNQTFGKGTVQNAIDLNRFLKIPGQKLGQVKLTIAKFYRIDGGSTQHVGVIPDIHLPSRYEYMEIGESTQSNALLWDQIDPLEVDYYGDDTKVIPLISKRHSTRLNSNEEFAELLEKIEEFRSNKDKRVFTLNEEHRLAEQKSKKDKEKEEEEENSEDLLLTESARILSDYIILSEKHASKMD